MRYEFRRFMTALIASLIPCGLLIVGLYTLYALMQASGGTIAASYALAALPEGLREFLAVLSPLDMSDPLAFFTRLYQPIVLVQNLIVAITAGRSLTSDEEGLAELMYASPISRTSVFLRRASGGLIYTVLLNVILFGLSFGGYCIFRMPTMSYVLAYAVIFFRILAAELAMYALGTMFSAVTRRAGIGAVWTASILVILWLLPAVPALTGAGSFLWYAALPHFSLPEYTFAMGWYFLPAQIIVMAAVFVLCELAAFFSYRRREFCHA